MIFIIVICVVFIVLCLMVDLCACLRIASLEDNVLIRQSEEEPSIENADIFIENIGKEKDGGYIVTNKEVRDAFLKNKNFNPDPSDVKILGVDLSEEDEI